MEYTNEELVNIIVSNPKFLEQLEQSERQRHRRENPHPDTCVICHPSWKRVPPVSTNKKLKLMTHCFVTINPKPGTNLKQFIKLCKKQLRSKTYEYILLCLEQRGESLEELGKGFHCHLLFKLKTDSNTLYDYSRSLKRAFFNVCHTSNTSLLNIQYLNKPATIAGKIEYILGKKNPEKKLKTSHDPHWRKLNTISRYYINGKSLEKLLSEYKIQCPAELSMENVTTVEKQPKYNVPLEDTENVIVQTSKKK